jgi:hypothetical protein
MRWPWRRRHPTSTGGQEARVKAERELARMIHEETPYYVRLARRQRELRERNHWGDAIAAIARKEHPL